LHFINNILTEKLLLITKNKHLSNKKQIAIAQLQIKTYNFNVLKLKQTKALND